MDTKNILLVIFILVGCRINKSLPNQSFIYSADQPIEGQIYTAERLRKYMDNKEFDLAVDLFSIDQQKRIKEFQNDKESFKLLV